MTARTGTRIAVLVISSRRLMAKSAEIQRTRVELMWKDSGKFQSAPKPRKWLILRWSGGFFAMAIIAAIFGFMDITPGIAGLSKLLFFFFLVFFVVSVGIGLVTE
jgi:uncharacterized membrane protein YtjA (UPF0391 family)